MARRKLRHKKLMLKLQYAEAELAEYNHVFDECKVNFINAHNERLNKFAKSTRSKIDDFLVEKDRQVLETIREQREKDLNETPKGCIKKLNKEIAKKTHPDKLLHLQEEEQQEKAELFKEAHKALEEKDWFDMQRIAMKLGVPLPEVSAEQLNMIEARIKRTLEEINKIKDTACWQWCHLESEEERVAFLEVYVQAMFGEILNENS